ncbi:2-phosphoglycolate phosphatase [Penicillium samsonianum]|uniref:2-phosphoglycolate phosphatase n=1 Tax=Penicillium samsonianum TaxID=1882272 RepID=UPI002547E77E|nr:2-phosphoglycolate phosphatase [Penicillium samsonianum]KAJ6118416.1 2-phosphoglycolate phosphatase [Penicillium samsonianum]
MTHISGLSNKHARSDLPLGVIWSGEELLPGAAEAIKSLRKQGNIAQLPFWEALPFLRLNTGKMIIFITNNSTESRANFCRRFEKFGIPIHIDDVFTSAYITAIYLSQVQQPAPPRDEVFILGSEGIENELSAAGIRHFGGTDPAFQRNITLEDFKDLAASSTLSSGVCAVVVGVDLQLNYLKLCQAVTYIRNGATFLATNTDATFPIFDTVFPAAGSVAAAVSRASDVQPLLMGKPGPYMMDAILARHGDLDRSRTCVVGDGIDTDIRFGVEQMLGTLLVLSGVSSRQDLECTSTKYAPEAFVEQLADLVL